MPKHAVLNGMFSITDVQGKILQSITKKEQTRIESHQRYNGLSSYEIRKGNDGIPGGNWEQNYRVLLYFQLIKKVGEIQTGKQFRIYYALTPIGFFALLSWINKKDFEKKFVAKSLARFIPLIANHWDELVKLLGEELLLTILKYSISQIDLIQLGKGGNPDNEADDLYDTGKQLKENTSLDFETHACTLTLSRFYSVMSLAEQESMEQNTDLKYQPNYEKVENDIIKRLTFVFYYNLLRMFHDDDFVGISIYESYAQQHLQPFLKNVEEGSYTAELNFKRFPEFKVEFIKKIRKSSNAVINIVKQDSELDKLFQKNLREVISKFELPKEIKLIMRDIK